MTRARLALAVAGFVVALLGVVLQDQRLAWGAIALLAASLFVRMLQRKQGNGNSGDTRL